jgi:AraC-like DNA-binding protein
VSVPAAGALQPVRRTGLSTTDPDEAHEHIRAAYADHSVRLSGSRDRFRFRHDLVDAGAFGVASYHHSMACRVRVDSLGFLLVGQMIGGRLLITSGDEELRPARGEVFLFPPSERMTVEWEDFRAGLVRLEQSVVDRVAAEVYGPAAPAGVWFTQAGAVSPDRARYWHGLVRYLHRDVLDNASVADSPLVRAQAVRMLATAALETFPNTAMAVGPQAPGNADASAVRRAVAYIDERAGDPIGLTDVAGAARVGPRTLQAAFRRHLGTTPIDHLREVRLERAHRDLVAADPTTGVTVALIASRWGFAHHGRFSARYRERFGHSPSRTLTG